MNIFQALYGVFILDETQGTPVVAVKRFYKGVLPVNSGLQDVQIVPFLPIISPAVASCVLVTLLLSDSSSSLLSQSMIVELVTDETEDNNCGIAFSSSLKDCHQCPM